MIAVFAMFAWLQSQGVSPIASTYLPVIFAAAAVTILELAFPNRTAWRPPAAEIKTDLVFMTTIQLRCRRWSVFCSSMLIEPVRALDLPVTASGRTDGQSGFRRS